MTGRCFTGVRAILCAAHKAKDGVLHGHTWEVTAYFPCDGTDAMACKDELEEVLREYDHSLLPDSLAWGEAIAAYVGEALDCASVDVARPAEGIFARWVAL